MPGDNVAIATRKLQAGTVITRGSDTFQLSHSILEGHRFAVVPIQKGEFLLSWELPFGVALKPIAPGDYVCNEKILQALAIRRIDFELPAEANFENHLVPFALDEQQFRPGQQVPRRTATGTFNGYARSGGRGVGTRNYLVVLGTSSLTASFARSLAEKFKDAAGEFSNVDGVVAVAHTEGGSKPRPNNLEFTLRTLAGFMVHPNVGAVLAVDLGSEPVNNALLQQYLAEHNYPIDHVPHQFLSVRGHYLASLAEADSWIASWLPQVNQARRTPQSLEHLRIGLQCGGSDAFSGISGNPLVGWVSKELLRHGGSANLAETDELMGAEPYVLRNVRDLETARRFLQTLERFQERARWHGHNAEGNPSGGNNYRGLYNIAIKSIGAARKKDPDVRLDYVIDYAQPMTAPGFYFMDSPGNDLESIAGQVGAGCNLILFTTGNGSITNFPFVPTIKVMTNTGRYELLTAEMDVNAGRYQDGTPMDQLGQETFDLTVRVAAGELSAGEKAGHSQVQLWREWQQKDDREIAQPQDESEPDGKPLSIRRPPLLASNASLIQGSAKLPFPVFQTENGVSTEQVFLIVPTSLCSGQIARLIADQLNAESAGQPFRYVALPHTEGCGSSGGASEELYLRTMAGYLAHPFVRSALLLEHGCEKTHNDLIRTYLDQHGIAHDNLGWASVQLDGGLEKVSAKVARFFASQSQRTERPTVSSAGLESIRLGLVSFDAVPDKIAQAFACVTAAIVEAGGTVVVPRNATFLGPFLEWLQPAEGELKPTLAYGQRAEAPGFHLMDAPTVHAVETFTGLAPAGVELILAHVSTRLLQGHPLVPLIQFGSAGTASPEIASSPDLDLLLDAGRESVEKLVQTLLYLMIDVLAREYHPKAAVLGNTDFQITRGPWGISL